jgi:DHA1 family bicyclomycin/chloramphenicol resistance-like MFS transporter
MTIPMAAHSRMAPRTVVLTLTLLMGVQPVSTDLYLPALPTIARSLGATLAAAQFTLSALILAFGVGQLAAGPLSDRWGRRPMLLGGLGCYVVASLLAATAPSIGWLIAWRALQGLALAAVVTTARSIIRDLYEPLDGARVMSRALTGLGAIAVVGPLVGATVVTALDWHAVMLVLGLFGAVTLAFVTRTFEETVPQRDPRATHVATLLRNWWQIVRDPTFGAFALLGAASYSGLFVFLASSSFVFIDTLGISRAAYGAFASSQAFAYLLGTLLCRRLLGRHGLRVAVRIGAAFSLAGGTTMAALSLTGWHDVWAIMLPNWLFVLGHGIHQPCSQAGAIGPFPEKAGTAASLSGFAMMAAAFAIGLWLGHSFDGTVYPLTLTIGACGVAVAAIAWTLVERHGEVRRAAGST